MKNNLNIAENLDETKRKQLDFMSNQLILHSAGKSGQKYNASTVRSALEVYLRSRGAHRALRQLLIVPCGKTMMSYFGKLGSAGSNTECKAVVSNVFSQLEGVGRSCFVTIDEIHVKPSIRYQANELVGMGVDQNPPKPAKTMLALMINFIYNTPAFIARFIPLTSLVAEFMLDQIEILMKIAHEASGSVFVEMADILLSNR